MAKRDIANGARRITGKSRRAVLQQGRITGPLVRDARIAALCADHGIRELWTADRDFSRFPNLNTINPLVG